jgi:predicted lipase
MVSIVNDAHVVHEGTDEIDLRASSTSSSCRSSRKAGKDGWVRIGLRSSFFAGPWVVKVQTRSCNGCGDFVWLTGPLVAGRMSSHVSFADLEHELFGDEAYMEDAPPLPLSPRVITSDEFPLRNNDARPGPPPRQRRASPPYTVSTGGGNKVRPRPLPSTDMDAEIDLSFLEPMRSQSSNTAAVVASPPLARHYRHLSQSAAAGSAKPPVPHQMMAPSSHKFREHNQKELALEDRMMQLQYEMRTVREKKKEEYERIRNRFTAMVHKHKAELVAVEQDRERIQAHMQQMQHQFRVALQQAKANNTKLRRSLDEHKTAAAETDRVQAAFDDERNKWQRENAWLRKELEARVVEEKRLAQVTKQLEENNSLEHSWKVKELQSKLDGFFMRARGKWDGNMLRRFKRRHLQAWSQLARATNRLRKRMKATLSRWMRQQEAAGFRQLYQHCRECKRLEHVKKKAVASLRGRKLHSALLAWQSLRARRHRARQFIRKMTFKYEHRVIAAGLRSWTEFVEFQHLESVTKIDIEEKATAPPSRRPSSHGSSWRVYVAGTAAVTIPIAVFLLLWDDGPLGSGLSVALLGNTNSTTLEFALACASATALVMLAIVVTVWRRGNSQSSSRSASKSQGKVTPTVRASKATWAKQSAHLDTALPTPPGRVPSASSPREFSVAMASHLAMVSAHAYDDSYGEPFDVYDFVEAFSTDNAAGLLCYSTELNRLTVAYRGTDDPMDWGNNMDVDQAEYLGVAVHAGFLRYYTSTADAVIAFVKQHATSRTECYTTGHSLGGNPSVLLALELKQKHGIVVSNYNFGTPRGFFGDTSALEAAVPHMYRVADRQDPVAEYAMGKCHHVGRLYYLSTEGDLVTNEDDSEGRGVSATMVVVGDRSKADSVFEITARDMLMVPEIKYHGMDRYIAALRYVQHYCTIWNDRPRQTKKPKPWNEQPLPPPNITANKREPYQFSLDLAHHFAKVSAQAYEPHTGAAFDTVYDVVESMASGNANGLMCYSSRLNRITIAYRGTDEVKDFLNNLDVDRMEYLGLGVHEGFYKYFQSTLDQVEAFIQRFKRAQTKLYTTGHSLGANPAILLSAYLQHKYGWTAANYNYGSPRGWFGDTLLLEQQLVPHLYRIADRKDPVVEKKMGNCHHVGRCYAVSSHGDTPVAGERGNLAAWVGVVGHRKKADDMFKLGPSSMMNLGYHSSDRYTASLQYALDTQSAWNEGAAAAKKAARDDRRRNRCCGLCWSKPEQAPPQITKRASTKVSPLKQHSARERPKEEDVKPAAVRGVHPNDNWKIEEFVDSDEDGETRPPARPARTGSRPGRRGRPGRRVGRML